MKQLIVCNTMHIVFSNIQLHERNPVKLLLLVNKTAEIYLYDRVVTIIMVRSAY